MLKVIQGSSVVMMQLPGEGKAVIPGTTRLVYAHFYTVVILLLMLFFCGQFDSAPSPKSRSGIG